MHLARALGIGVMLVTCLNAQQPETIIFKPVKIDGPIHDPANHTYWFGPFSETCSVGDLDGDGDLDIAAANNWYEAPLWIKHTRFRDGGEINGPETESNSEFAMDVNKDGLLDIVSSGWMFMKGVYWYENPGNKTDIWKSSRIHRAFNLEGAIHAHIDGDEDEDILVNHWSLVEGQGLTWLEHIDEAPWFIEHVVGRESDSHGNGAGDINMDGRTDFVMRDGWYEQPEDSRASKWEFHPDWLLEPSLGRGNAGSHPLLVHDVNEDGLNDVIVGNGHSYGLIWVEQKLENGVRTFEEHYIETDFSQFHTLAMGDLNGDGKDDLVAGKRLYAHHGDDMGAMEPLFLFWYDLNGGDIKRHVLSFQHLPYYPEEGGMNPAPNYVVGAGMKMNVADMDDDGDNDVIVSGKGGLYIFYNEGRPPTPGNLHMLAPETNYPTWREWGAYAGLFNGKDLTGWRGDEEHWKVIDGVIDYDGMSQADDKNLWTEEEFADYKLHIEWRLKDTPGLYNMPEILPDGTYKTDADGNVIRTPTPNADSGILLRGPGHQANIWNWAVGSGELWSVRTNEDLPTELRAAAVPKKKMDFPIGQWNMFDITVIGDRVSVMLNREMVIENARIPGLPESGPVGLQHHGSAPETGEYDGAASVIQFRNIWIDRFEDERGPTPEQWLQRYGFVEEEGFEPLFDGTSLEGWLTGPDNAWVIENGAVTLQRTFDGAEHNADYLWTEEEYGDFIFDFEFKVAENTNSGVFFRTSDIGDPVYTGFEMQVNNSYGSRALHRRGTVGAVYDLKAPSKNASKPAGEWQTGRIMCRGSVCKTFINGEQVLQMDLARWTKPHMNPDGTTNKFGTAGAAFAREGRIGLQDHGRPVWYRNMRVKRLD